MVDNWMFLELLAAQRLDEHRRRLDEVRRLRLLGLVPSRQGLRQRLARALVGVSLRLDANATRSMLSARPSRG